jgi:type VI secretion system protein ImpH
VAGDHGTQAGAVSFLAEIEQEPYRFGFYQTIRRLNCLFQDKPVTGTSFRPADDPLRFRQDPYTSFAPSTLNSLKWEEGSQYPKLSQRFFGLFGPQGPLPLHLTEYARDRLRHHRDPTFARFADIFHHRIISLFYRAWAQAQPTVQFDRPDEDRFSIYLGSLIGIASDSLRNADDMYHMSKLSFAGHLGSLPRHCDGLESILAGYFDIPSKVTEFIAHWMKIPGEDHLLLGSGTHNGRLGMNTVIGERVWQRQDKFRISLGPLSLEDYVAFLPSGKSFDALVAVVQNYVGLELLWEVNLVLKKEEKPVTCLGKSGALGWTSWLESKEQQENVDDLLLQVQNYVH